MIASGGKYLIFHLGAEEYGVPIQSVKEIIRIMDITTIPKMPVFLKGVINLRGKIIPIMDLRLKFGFDEREYNSRTCIIVAEIATADSKRQMGVVVDAVSEVLNIQKSEIEPPPQYDAGSDVEFLIGMGKVKGKVILLVDIQNVLDHGDIALLKKIDKEEGLC